MLTAKRPKFISTNKPIISRPEFHVFGENHSAIRGAGATRCMFCGCLLDMKEEVCKCGSTQIDMGYVDLDEAPDIKNRYKLLGNPRGGFNGC